jgi:hypothetical protein
VEGLEHEHLSVYRRAADMMPRNCPACHAEAEPGARFCAVCGQNLNAPVAPPKKDGLPRIVRWTLYGVVGLFALAGLGSILSAGSKTQPTTPVAAATPNIEGTVVVRVSATLTALPKPTTAVVAAAAPTTAPTPVPPTAPTAPPKPAPTVVARMDPVTINGSSTMKSRPTHLPAGNYSVAWTDKAGQFAGNFIARLMPASSTSALGGTSIANVILQSGETKNGETQAYNLKEGDYYVDVVGQGDWKVVIAPH